MSWLPYVAPMAVFVLLSALEGYAPEAFYLWLYFAKVAVVTALF